MRLENWNWGKANAMVGRKSIERLRKAAKVIAKNVRSECPVGTISRPMYKTGVYAGQPWTKRDGGALKKSIRVVEKKEKFGTELNLTALANFGRVRVYAGHYYAYYAAIVEFYTPFMRPALEKSKSEVKSILENG